MSKTCTTYEEDPKQWSDKPQQKRPHGKSKYCWENNIKINLIDKGNQGLDCTQATLYSTNDRPL